MPPRKKTKRAGRPKLPEHLKKRREKRLVIMLWDEEDALIVDAAGGVNVSSWARDVLLREATKAE